MQDPKDVKNKRGVSVSGNTDALWVPGLIPGSITQALIDPGKLIRLINHREDGRKQNEFPDYKKVKAEGNRQGRDPSLKPLPPPVSLTEQGRSILSHLKFNHDVWRRRAQMTQGKKRSIIHHSYSISWPDFGTLTQWCSIKKSQKCCYKRTFQSFDWKTWLSTSLTGYKMKSQTTGQHQ